jgi:prefoldin subunit 5
MQTQSTCYRGTRKTTVKGILWHDTGANNKTLKRYVQPSDTRPAEDTYSKDEWLRILGKNTNGNDWNHIERQAGLNCWIGTLADGTVTTVQTMPWDYRPWGCGSGSKGTCNDGWIQFEICQDAKTDKNYFEATYKEACEITAYLCKLYGIDPHGTVVHNGVTVPTILCHQDSYRLKLGSNHSDMYDWFNKYGRTMDDVRNDVAALMRGDNGGKEEMRYFKIVDPTGMNMRTEPNKTLVQNIPQGAVISGTKFKTANNVQWLYTTYNGKSGYVAVLPESKGYAKEVTDEYNKPAPAPTTNWEAKYNEVNTKLTAANNQISTLTKQVSDLTNANNTLNTQLAVANNQVGALTGQVNELNGKVNTLTSQVEKLDSEKKALAAEHSKCASNNQVIANFKNALNDLLK